MGCVAFLGVGPSILAFLDSGWVSISFTGMQHLQYSCDVLGFIVDSPISTFFEGLAAPFGGCAIFLVGKKKHFPKTFVEHTHPLFLKALMTDMSSPGRRDLN